MLKFLDSFLCSPFILESIVASSDLHLSDRISAWHVNEGYWNASKKKKEIYYLYVLCKKKVIKESYVYFSLSSNYFQLEHHALYKNILHMVRISLLTIQNTETENEHRSIPFSTSLNSSHHSDNFKINSRVYTERKKEVERILGGGGGVKIGQ